MLRHSSGFTLTEVLIALVILGLAAVLIIPAFSSYEDHHKITAAAQEVATALRYARSEAITAGSAVVVQLDTNNERCEVLNIRNPLDKNPYILDFISSPIMGGVDIVTVGGSPGVINITFNADGRPNAASGIILSYATHSKTVSVQDTTGRVSIQ